MPAAFGAGALFAVYVVDIHDLPPFGKMLVCMIALGLGGYAPEIFVKNAIDDLLETGCLIVELPGRLRTGFALAFKRVLDERDVCRLRQMDAAAARDQKPAQTVARHGRPPGSR